MARRDARDPPAGMRALRQKRNRAAFSRSCQQRNLESSEPPEQFVRWQLALVSKQAANLYPDKSSAVDAHRSARDSFQLISQPLRATKLVSTNLTSTLTEVTINVVPLGSFLRWLSSTAGYVPGNEAQISLSDIAHH